MTDEQFVKQKYPKAMTWWPFYDKDSFFVVIPPINCEVDIQHGDRLSADFPDEESAWADARKRIESKPIAEVVTPKETSDLKSSVTLHYRTLALMNEALEATRDSKQSSAYRVAEFVCRTTPPMPPEAPSAAEVISKCKFCGDSHRPLNEHGYCKACVEGMERTNGD